MTQDLSRVRRNGDRGILEALARHGDMLLEARHTLVFFCLLKEDARAPELVLNPLGLRATQNSWRIASMDARGLIIET